MWLSGHVSSHLLGVDLGFISARCGSYCIAAAAVERRRTLAGDEVWPTFCGCSICDLIGLADGIKGSVQVGGVPEVGDCLEDAISQHLQLPAEFMVPRRIMTHASIHGHADWYECRDQVIL